MAGKSKGTKGREVEVETEVEAPAAIETKAELKTFLTSVRDQLISGSAPAIFAMTSMNHVLQLPAVYDLMDTTNKEILQEIWVKLSQGGLQIRKPPLLFSDIEAKSA
jgi:hypothetical protein